MEYRWYVIKVPYGKALQVNDYLRTQSIRTFFPMAYRRGDENRRLVPVIYNLCFVYETEESLRRWLGEIELHFGGAIYAVPYIDRATMRIMVVPQLEMERFIQGYTIVGSDAVWLDPNTVNFRPGDYVRVTGGPFEGLEGHIMRIKRQQRVVLKVGNLMAIASVYIPTTLIERIPVPDD